MKKWDNIFRVIIIIMGLIVIAFNAQLYIYCKEQRGELNSVKDKQDVEAEFNSNKFKYEEDRIERISKDLEDTRQQVTGQKDALAQQKDELSAQKDALLEEVEKRQGVENANKNLQTSLVDTKAEADAIKQDMKSWQKDYVGVLVKLDKKMDNAQDETKNLEDALTALNIPELKENIKSLKAEIEAMPHPADNAPPETQAPPDKKIEHESMQGPQ